MRVRYVAGRVSGRSASYNLASLSSLPLPPSPQTNLEISGEADFSKLLQQEEEYIEKMCQDIIALKPDLVITEKGLSGWYGVSRVLCELTFCVTRVVPFQTLHSIFL